MTYKSKLDTLETQKAVSLAKDIFEKALMERLPLIKVPCPRFLITGTGLQDDLACTQTPVSFQTRFTERPIELVHSLAKWKRYTLGRFGFREGEGILTDMFALRKDEEVGLMHSIFVDQWDWERVISPTERTLFYLKGVVCDIYGALREAEQMIHKTYGMLAPRLPGKIFFIHSEQLEKEFPGLTTKEREEAITKRHGAVFLIGIGHALSSGAPHDLRAADYDDWSTATSSTTKGLNGDILLWDSVGERAFEISSMGIRVDKETLTRQLKIMGLSHYADFPFHKDILEGRLPQTIGGGIGQSRACMFLLQKMHIGEVQPSVWPEAMVKECREKEILLL